MKGILVQTTLNEKKDLREIIRSGIIGTSSKALGSQPPSFKDRPLVFCSYVCRGYPEVYGNREGIMFETDSQIAYACPTDSFELMRSGNYLPGHERFLFPSIKEMLKRYPTSEDFKKDFQEYFRKLKPEEIYTPGILMPENHARVLYEGDYCLSTVHLWNPGCNEVTFAKPLRVKNCRMFNSKEELAVLYRE